MGCSISGFSSIRESLRRRYPVPVFAPTAYLSITVSRKESAEEISAVTFHTFPFVTWWQVLHLKSQYLHCSSVKDKISDPNSSTYWLLPWKQSSFFHYKKQLYIFWQSSVPDLKNIQFHSLPCKEFPSYTPVPL